MTRTHRTDGPRAHHHEQSRDAAPADRSEPARDASTGERAHRVGAAQLAAPSTRTWRRAGRFATQ